MSKEPQFKNTKVMIIFFDLDSEAMCMIESPHGITIDQPKRDLNIKNLVSSKKIKIPAPLEPYTIKIAPYDKQGKGNVIHTSIDRKQDVMYTPHGIFYGKWLETKREYLKRERQMIKQFVKR